MIKSLILGGVRSGKTRYAQHRAIKSGLPVRLIVTGQALDAEMAERIKKHQASRPENWEVIEVPLDLPENILKACHPKVCVIVDCLTLWLSNYLCQRPESFEKASHTLLEAVDQANGTLFLVSNEVGFGIVPDNALARRFRDEAGRLHQQLGQRCNEIKLIVAGQSLSLKDVPWFDCEDFHHEPI